MSARVFILRRHGVEEGPYSEEEVLDALDAGDLSARDWCRLENQPHAQMLGEVFERVAIGDGDEGREEGDDGRDDRGDDGEDDGDGDEEGVRSRGFVEDEGEHEHEHEHEEEIEEEIEEEREEPEEGETVVYQGTSSLMGYGWPMLVAGGVLAAGYWLGRFGVKWVVGSLVVVLLLVVRILVHRAARDYLVTTERVEATLGLLAKTSRQIPLRRLGSIRLHRRWPLSWLGVGTVIFSSDGGGGGDDVVFERIGRVRRVIATVRDWQLRQGRR